MAVIDEKLDQETVRIAAMGKRLAAQVGCCRLLPEVYAVAILETVPNVAAVAGRALGGDVDAILARSRQVLQTRLSAYGMAAGAYFVVSLDEVGRKLWASADQYRAASGARLISPSHLLLGALKISPELARVCQEAGLTLAALESACRPKPNPRRSPSAPETVPCGEPEHPPIAKPVTSEKALAQFCVDLTQLAAAGRLDPVIGREREINRIVTILSRKKKHNPLLVGEQGTGKTCIVEGLAQRLAAGTVPQRLVGRRIHSVDMARLVAGTVYRGQFEERLEALVDATKRQPGCILFVDEIHTMIGAGNAMGALDAANILKPALARGDICCIGATTEAEYKKVFRKDKALDRRFQRVPVAEPSPQETIQILSGLRGSLEAHHHCTITDEAIEAAVALSARHLADRFCPDRAIDVIDEMAARFGGNGQQLGREHVAQTVAEQVGVPLETVLPRDTDRARLVRDELQRLVVGQPGAIDAVTRAVQRAFSPLRNPARPLASLVFGGPSSAGKSYVAQIISRQLYAASPLLRLNMAEYTEKFSVTRLVGAPPGYIGHGDRNQLTDPVSRHPHSVIVFDNLDKAHPEVLHLLMEMLDVGSLTDAEGNTVSFRSAFIVMTTVAGSGGGGKERLGFASPAGPGQDDPARGRLREACRDLFGDEFTNRVDDYKTAGRLPTREEIDTDRQLALYYAQQHGVGRIFGSDRMAAVTAKPEWQIPTKTENPAAYDEMIARLRASPFWAQLTDFSRAKLVYALDAPEGRPLVSVLDRLIRIGPACRISLKKRSPPD